MSLTTGTAQQILDRVLAAESAGPGPRIIAVDGPSGSGKSTLASRICELSAAPVVHMDDLYDGWDGLDTGVRLLVDGILAPLSRGEDGSAPRYDWMVGVYRGVVEVPLTDLLVVEGVGAGARACAPYLTLLVWLETGAERRLSRAVDRDGKDLRGKLITWQALESSHHIAEGTRDRADLRFVT